MRWAYGGMPGWYEAETPAGVFVITESGCGFLASWWPPGASDGVNIGNYRTQAAAKGACKRYAKRMAAAFKAMGKAGWQ